MALLKVLDHTCAYLLYIRTGKGNIITLLPDSVPFLHTREMGNLDQTSLTAIAKYLNTVVPFVEEYEKKEFSTVTSTPEEMLRFLMEQRGLSQYDIADDLGGKIN